MPPADQTPRGGEVMPSQPEPKYPEPKHPEPKPGQESDEPVRGQPGAGAQPDAEVSDDKIDPVTHTGRDIAG